MMAATLSCEKMNFLAMVAALVGSLSVSPTTSSMGRPVIPPSWLIFFTTISATSLVGVPMGAAGPDRAKKAPILMGSAAEPGTATAQSKATARMIASLLFMKFVLLK